MPESNKKKVQQSFKLLIKLQIAVLSKIYKFTRINLVYRIVLVAYWLIKLN